MLILSRFKDERIVITTREGLIFLSVLGLSPTREQVKLGFDAPREIAIDREEVAREKGILSDGTSSNHTG